MLWDMLAAASISDNFFQFNASAIVAVGSAVVTVYFWFIKANREKAGLKIYQADRFTPSRRTLPSYEQEKHPGMVRAFWTGDLYVANMSTLPSAVIGAEVELQREGKWVSGAFGWSEGAALPWNLDPLKVDKHGVAAFFYLPESVEGEELSRDHQLRFTFTTVDGRRFRKVVQTTFTSTGNPS